MNHASITGVGRDELVRQLNEARDAAERAKALAAAKDEQVTRLRVEVLDLNRNLTSVQERCNELLAAWRGTKLVEEYEREHGESDARTDQDLRLAYAMSAVAGLVVGRRLERPKGETDVSLVRQVGAYALARDEEHDLYRAFLSDGSPKARRAWGEGQVKTLEQARQVAACAMRLIVGERDERSLAGF